MVRDKSWELDGLETTRANRWEIETLSGLIGRLRWDTAGTGTRSVEAGPSAMFTRLNSALEHGSFDAVDGRIIS